MGMPVIKLAITPERKPIIIIPIHTTKAGVVIILRLNEGLLFGSSRPIIPSMMTIPPDQLIKVSVLVFLLKKLAVCFRFSEYFLEALYTSRREIACDKTKTIEPAMVIDCVPPSKPNIIKEIAIKNNNNLIYLMLELIYQ